MKKPPSQHLDTILEVVFVALLLFWGWEVFAWL